MPSSQGQVTIHSALNFARLRKFAPVHDHLSSCVDHIILHGETILWNVGSKVCCWKVGNLIPEVKSRVKVKGRNSPKQISKWIEKAELKAELAESAKIMEDQRRHDMKVQKRIQNEKKVFDDLGLNEREALEYALMLSRETAEEERRRAYMDEGVFLEDDRLQRPEPLPAAEDIKTADGSAATSSTTLSRRGSETFHTEGGSGSRAGNSDGGVYSTQSTSVESGFPVLCSSFGSCSRSQSTSSHSPPQSQGLSWARLVRATDSLLRDGSIGGDSSPGLGPSEEMDDDLRYALEVSLAESRRDM